MRKLVAVAVLAFVAFAVSGCAALGRGMTGFGQGFNQGYQYHAPAAPRRAVTFCRPDYGGGTICNAY